MTPQLANGAGCGAQKVNFASEVPRSRRNGGNRSEKLQVRRSTISWQASRVSSPLPVHPKPGKSFQAIFVALFSGGVHIVTGWEVAGEMFCHGRQALPANALVRRNAQNPSRRCKWRGTGTFGKGGR